jgi:RHS repeat-associated protein
MMWGQSRPKAGDPDGEEWLYFYTADDEKVWSYHGSGSDWTLRDLGGQVLRHYRHVGTNWSVERDYVYAGGRLLAGTKPGDTTYHYHRDHLGSPRLITNANGVRQAYHVYYPYGEEATAAGQDTERMKFTGHEREFAASGVGDDLDYMHARWCSPVTGRFMAVDPLDNRDPLKAPQRWNRYGYALGNPLAFTDPNGEEPATLTAGAIAGIVVLTVATVAVVNHTYQMQTNPEYRESAISAGEAVGDAVSGAIEAMQSAIMGETAIEVGTETVATDVETVTLVESQTNAPGRGGPPPTAIPGQRPRTTPAPTVRPAPADDPQQPPMEGEITKGGQDNVRQKIWDLAGELAGGGTSGEG